MPFKIIYPDQETPSSEEFVWVQNNLKDEFDKIRHSISDLRQTLDLINNKIDVNIRTINDLRSQINAIGRRTSGLTRYGVE